MKKNTIHVTLPQFDFSAFTTIKEHINLINKIVEAVPKEHKDSAFLDFRFDDYYGSCILVSYNREETDEEFEQRQNKEKEQRKKQKESELELYKKLKAKYEK